MKRLIWASALCVALVGTWIVRAAPSLAPRVEADPNQEYVVTPEVGPWMICAAYFNGPAAPDLAHQMVQQIRSRYNMPAFVFNYADEERKKQKALLDQHPIPFPEAAPANAEDVRPAPIRRRTIRVEDQYAVMIGGYPDEIAAHKALMEVKHLNPPELKVKDDSRPFGSVIDDQGKEKQVNPFATQSMVVRNPTVPHEAKKFDKMTDPFLKTLNAYEEYSMLRCSGKYTLAVKEYMAAQMIQNQQAESSGFLKMLGMNSSHADESLNVAANNAHVLAAMLEKRGGFKAYVLHTRTSSVVSIGSFNGPEDPELGRVKEKLARWQQEIAQQAADPTKKDPLGLYSTPVSMEVPHP